MNISDYGDFNTMGKIAYELKHADQYMKGEFGFDLVGDNRFGKPIAYDILMNTMLTNDNHYLIKILFLMM